jgi:hypothetical protein
LELLLKPSVGILEEILRVGVDNGAIRGLNTSVDLDHVSTCASK